MSGGSVVVARLLRWGHPSVNRPGYTAGHVEVPLGRVVTRPGPDRKPIPVGEVVATKDTPAGLEATIRLRDNAEGAETASEIVDGYRPAVDVTLQPLTNDPATFKPRSRVDGIVVSTLIDPGDDHGRVLSVDGRPVGAPESVDMRPVAPVKPAALKAAEQMLIEAGAGSSWWAIVG